MKIEPVDLTRHDLGWQDAYRKLVLFAQPLGERSADLPAREAQFVGEAFCSVVEIGKMVLPALNRTACRGGGVFHDEPLAPTCAAPRIVKSRKCCCDLRRGGKEFLHILAVDAQITEASVGKTARHSVEPTDRIVLAQAAWIEVESLDDLHQHARGKGALIALYEVEVGRRYAEKAGHRGLGEAFPFAQTAQGRTGKKSVAHEPL